ncbi:response regulator transcription factor [Leucothrix mucor]|uniref:response regulator transcription factor n=1 Tax=Leucothrix mucor TaxID=45248 RepID=UPI0003B5C23A|nr:response regulator transcription factor [Leucothrix mucor]
MTFSVLIVEDDDLHRSFLHDTLKESDLGPMEITEACDGDEAIALLQNQDFSSVILDLQMPGKTGVDVARVVWAKDHSTPILFWSNYADEAYVRGIFRVAPEDANYGYLLKSTSSQLLKRTIAGVFFEGQTIIDRAVSFARNSSNKNLDLNATEYEVLVDIAIGLTDSAIAEYRSISVRAVQGRLKGVYEKLGVAEVASTKDGSAAMNRRARAVAIALTRRKINSKILDMAEKELRARDLGHFMDG